MNWLCPRAHEPHAHRIALLVALVFVSSVKVETGRSAEADLAEELKLPLWYPSFAMRGAFGYKDNVTLSQTAAEASAFWLTGVEALVFRLPTRGWQFNMFVSAEDVRYFDAESVDNEQIATAVGQVSKDFGEGWKSTLGVNYLFQNQVFDFSTTYTGPDSIGQVRGHYLSPRWSGRKKLGDYHVEVEMIGTRQWLEAPLDSYWQVGPRLAAGRAYGFGSEATLSYSWSQLNYDTRLQSDRAGNPLTGTSLALQTHLTELSLTHLWDEKKRWRTVTRLGFEANLDNGSGFYDYMVARIVQELRYRTPTWEVTARARAGYYDFPNQTTAADSDEKRERTLVSAGIRVEKKLRQWLKLQVAYTYEQSFSNMDFDSYEANTVSGGFAVEF